MNIEKCPARHCQNECAVGDSMIHKGMYSVTCNICDYWSPECKTESEAIHFHNHISRCVRAFEGVDVGEVLQRWGADGEFGSVESIIRLAMGLTKLDIIKINLLACLKDGE